MEQQKSTTERRRISGVTLLSAALALTACAPVAAPTTIHADGRPSLAQCTGPDARLANIDMAAIARDPADAAPLPIDVSIPEDAAHRPPEDALIVVTTRVPANPHHPFEDRGVVWREADGQWMFWRMRLDWRPIYHGGAPQRVEVSPGQWREVFPTPESIEAETVPVSGALNPEQAATMEAAWADPCRVWEPQQTPFVVPLLRREDGRRERVCPAGATPLRGIISEAGQPARWHWYACDMGLAHSDMLHVATYARP